MLSEAVKAISEVLPRVLATLIGHLAFGPRPLIGQGNLTRPSRGAVLLVTRDKGAMFTWSSSGNVSLIELQGPDRLERLLWFAKSTFRRLTFASHNEAHTNELADGNFVILGCWACRHYLEVYSRQNGQILQRLGCEETSMLSEPRAIILLRGGEWNVCEVVHMGHQHPLEKRQVVKVRNRSSFLPAERLGFGFWIVGKEREETRLEDMVSVQPEGLLERITTTPHSFRGCAKFVSPTRCLTVEAGRVCEFLLSPKNVLTIVRSIVLPQLIRQPKAITSFQGALVVVGSDGIYKLDLEREVLLEFEPAPQPPEPTPRPAEPTPQPVEEAWRRREGASSQLRRLNAVTFLEHERCLYAFGTADTEFYGFLLLEGRPVWKILEGFNPVRCDLHVWSSQDEIVACTPWETTLIID